MVILFRGIEVVKTDWPTAKFNETIEVILNLSTLAAHLGDTRAKIEGMVARGVFPIGLVSDDGKPLWKMSDMGAYREGYHAELTASHNRARAIFTRPTSSDSCPADSEVVSP
jgi:hypothetical protein